MQVQINDVLQQQNIVQVQLCEIKSNQDKIMSFLEMSLLENKPDKDGIDLKSIVSELRSTSNKLTSIAIQHNTGVSEVRSITNKLNALVSTHWPKKGLNVTGDIPSSSKQGAPHRK
ncbi:hypothetical protein GOP47_0007705 [Adiantum capillus-veneris]|uniref:Uncharacterized protein n=1 Tax=Adiantum capillus-veneris TaxID=13818 RepID=A0A9D4V180_ADICA|nr:hypothetical protein GOP47_0007705 [Adiantum capillus-veneris]